jgi:hypothetical protein
MIISISEHIIYIFLRNALSDKINNYLLAEIHTQRIDNLLILNKYNHGSIRTKKKI